MVKKLLISLLLLTLMGCGDKPEWFIQQGVNITECGPTVAANSIKWAGGQLTREQARKYFTTPKLWRLSEIYSTISRNGVHVTYKHESDLDLVKNPNIKGVLYINYSHFVHVDYIDNKWLIYDPLFHTITETDKDDILRQSWVNYIAVYKK